MNGIDKIISKINLDSSERCEQILEKAQKDCDRIIANAKAEGEKFQSEILENAKAQADSTVAMAQSSAAQISRQTLLSAKVDLISQALDKLLYSMKNLPVDEYFGAIIKLAVENAVGGECVAKLSSEDNKRKPADFGDKLISALAKVGASCVLSDEDTKIESGIILIYGDIEVNCSFEAVIEEKSDMLKAKISEILF